MIPKFDSITMMEKLAKAIRDARKIGNGALYTCFADQLTVDQFKHIIEVLKKSRNVEEIHYFLIWRN